MVRACDAPVMQVGILCWLHCGLLGKLCSQLCQLTLPPAESTLGPHQPEPTQGTMQQRRSLQAPLIQQPSIRQADHECTNGSTQCRPMGCCAHACVHSIPLGVSVKVSTSIGSKPATSAPTNALYFSCNMLQQAYMQVLRTHAFKPNHI